jgi:hypothetical protein
MSLLFDLLTNWAALWQLKDQGEKLYNDGKITLQDFETFKSELLAVIDAAHGAANGPANPSLVPIPATPDPYGRPPEVIVQQEALLKKYASWMLPNGS